MYPYVRIAIFAYALTVFGGGYVAVNAIKNLWGQTERMNNLVALSAAAQGDLERTTLIFDSLEPAAGE